MSPTSRSAGVSSQSSSTGVWAATGPGRASSAASAHSARAAVLTGAARVPGGRPASLPRPAWPACRASCARVLPRRGCCMKSLIVLGRCRRSRRPGDCRPAHGQMPSSGLVSPAEPAPRSAAQNASLSRRAPPAESMGGNLRRTGLCGPWAPPGSPVSRPAERLASKRSKPFGCTTVGPPSRTLASRVGAAGPDWRGGARRALGGRPRPAPRAAGRGTRLRLVTVDRRSCQSRMSLSLVHPAIDRPRLAHCRPALPGRLTETLRRSRSPGPATVRPGRPSSGV